MRRPKTSGNDLLAAYCRAYGLDLDAERAAIHRCRRDDALRAYALAEIRDRAPAPPPRLDPRDLALVIQSNADLFRPVLRELLTDAIRDLVSGGIADELPAALRALQLRRNHTIEVHNGQQT